MQPRSSKSPVIRFALAGLLVSICSAAEINLVARHAVWRYLDDGSNQGSAWIAPAFNDSSWAAGPAQLGYGDGDESTVIGYGPNPNARFITSYFRHTFTLPDPAAWTRYRIRVVRDDGAVIYLNGQEIYRTNMPAGTPGYLTLASSAVADSAEDRSFVADVPPGRFVAGVNVLAAEVHQSGSTSSDVSFSLELTATNAPAFLSRGPYLQRTAPTAAVLRWRTDVATDSRVLYGPTPANLSNVVSSAALTTEHEITLTPLAPGSRYYYAVGTSGLLLAGGDVDHRFETHPAPTAPTPLRIWAHGDYGTADLPSERVRDAFVATNGAAAPDVWLTLGDNTYDSGLDVEYTDGVFDIYRAQLRQTAIWLAYGNHDAVTSDANSQSGPYFAMATLPRNAESGGRASNTEAYYSFDYGDVHFVCLDSAESSRLTSDPMMTWLSADLAATPARWIIAYWHHPPYTKGSHDSDDPGDSGGAMRDMRELALPILEAAGVDLVLCGHSHSYERSFLLDGHYGLSGTLTADMILNGGDGDPAGDGPYVKRFATPTPHDGTVYVVAGSGGQLDPGPLDHPAMHASILERGSLVIDVNGNRLDARFVNDVGQIRDAFTLVKGAPNGDLDLDCDVDLTDLATLLAHFGTTSGGTPAQGDTNGDGAIDLADLAAVLAAFGARCF
jgi:Calcineurin-like phosphoesterase/Purple acid Phosphatase, N-terminal domain